MADDPILLQSETKLDGKAGNLGLTPDRLLWAEVGQSPAFSLGIVQIKKVLVATAAQVMLKIVSDAPGDDGKVFVFTSPDAMKERDSFKDMITERRGGIAPSKPPPAKAVATIASGGGVPKDELEYRLRVLTKYPNLAKIHKELVEVNKTVNDAEFWAGREELVRQERLRSEYQRTGLQSAMPDVRPIQQTTNAVKFSLTPEIKQHLFVAKPWVEREYKAMVPTKMPDQEFWNRYCTALEKNRDENTVRARAKEKDPIMSIFDKITKPGYTEGDDTSGDKSRALLALKRRRDDADIEVLRGGDYDEYTGYGLTVPAEPSEPKHKRQRGEAQVRDINRHSALILRQSGVIGVVEDCESEDTARIIRRREAAVESGPARAPIPLNMRDQRQIAERAEPVAHVDVRDSQAVLDDLVLALSRWDPSRIVERVPSTDVVRSVLTVLGRLPSTGDTDGPRVADASLSEDFVRKLCALDEKCNELLRHFWGVAVVNPLPGLPPEEDRRSRVVASLEKLLKDITPVRAKLQEAKKLPSAEAMQPLFSKIEAALEYEQRRKEAARKAPAVAVRT